MGKTSHKFGMLLLGFLLAVALAVSSWSGSAMRANPGEAGVTDGAVGLNEAYEKTSRAMAFWMARLPSGPSNGGGGHFISVDDIGNQPSLRNCSINSKGEGLMG